MHTHITTPQQPQQQERRQLRTRVWRPRRTNPLCSQWLSALSPFISWTTTSSSRARHVAGDHLASGLVPIGVLSAIACDLSAPPGRCSCGHGDDRWARSRSALGTRRYYLLDGSAREITTPVCSRCSPAPRCSCCSGPSRSGSRGARGGSRRRRCLRRLLTVATGTIVLAWPSIWFLVFPIGLAYIYTHTGRGRGHTESRRPLRADLRSRRATDCELAAFYFPSKNRAAIVLFPGVHSPEASADADPPRIRRAATRPTRTRLERGRHRPLGRRSRPQWPASATSTRRPDVAPNRIGGFGFSDRRRDSASRRPPSRQRLQARSSPTAQAAASVTRTFGPATPARRA